MHHIKFCRKKSVVRNLHHVWQNGVGGKSIEVRKGEYFSFKVFGSQRRKERKKETSCGYPCTNSLSSHFFPIWEERKMWAQLKTIHQFSFSSLHFSPTKERIFLILPAFSLPVFTFSPSSLNPDKVLVKVFKVLG